MATSGAIGRAVALRQLTNRKIIRLLRQGCPNRPFYVMVVQLKHKDVFDLSAIVEQVGSFDPFPNEHGEKLCALNFDRIRYWLGTGCLTSKPVDQLLGLSGLLPVHPMSFIGAKRNRERKAAKEKQEAESAEKTSSSSSTSSSSG